MSDGILKNKGFLIISFDFELYWGVRDTKSLDNYEENILGEHNIIPKILRLFSKNNIHATWATVGFLFCKDTKELIRTLPNKKPSYKNKKLSPYEHVKNMVFSQTEEKLYYAPSIIKLIASSPHQEIGTHTFSHYFCLEKGQTSNEFAEDLKCAKKVAKKYKITLKSLVFPRNQVNRDYLSICAKEGIIAYRGTESSWLYSARSSEEEFFLRRLLRLFDAYINISGHNCHSLNNINSNLPLNIPSSRFLRPYSKRLKFLEWIRLHRILADMTYAAKKGLIYHLWWHPHNFGINQEKNLLFLKKILDHFSMLEKIYGMESLNMGELANKIMNKNEK